APGRPHLRAGRSQVKQAADAARKRPHRVPEQRLGNGGKADGRGGSIARVAAGGGGRGAASGGARLRRGGVGGVCVGEVGRRAVSAARMGWGRMRASFGAPPNSSLRISSGATTCAVTDCGW